MNSDFNIAVHALVYLSHTGQSQCSEALADNICTHSARVRKVLAKLSQAGLVTTREGRPNGGYALARQAEEISLQQVSEALDTCFVSTCWKSGDPHKECAVASGMAQVMDTVYQELNGCCQQYLVNITIHDLEKRIFHS